MRIAFHDLLSDAATAAPDSPALTYRDHTSTYRETWEAAQAVAAQLVSLGIAKGDRVAICLEKRIETVVAMFATSLAGGIFVPVSHVLRDPQVAHILSDSGARFAVTSAERLTRIGGLLVEAEVDQVVVIGGPDDAPFALPRVHRWADRHPHGGFAAPRVIDPDPAAIIYTSGSTGRPKGVVLSHRNLIVGAESVSSYLGNTSDDVILSVLPLSFDAGLSQVTTAFAVRAHCVLMNYLTPHEVPRLCVRHGVTGITGVPPLWIQLSEVEWPGIAVHHVRYWANTGGRMPRGTLDRLRGILTEARPFLMYGLTEAFRSTYLDPSEVDRRPDSIGKAIPDAEVLVLHPDGTPCGPGEEGELVHRGPLVALGYWNDPDQTAVRFRPVERPDQPWRTPEYAVWSGDTVVADEDGFLYHLGRRDEMIKTSGYRVSPTDVEEAVYSTGLVREAVAFGMEDAAIGARIVLVVAAPDAEALDQAALIAHLHRVLPWYMVPSEVRVVRALPRSPNGKFDRAALRAEVRI
ncbi:acyl-CoA ligase (AMP-forming), exosortase A system-associated [Microbacterium sp. AZCO]|uniref:acyl-CoA ligase (AMP-forming), exosortase A system-associated n=1 Tax=Microbacterium sp. AZCO TaxID=3142976 RepID=UPI0031F339DF